MLAPQPLPFNIVQAPKVVKITALHAKGGVTTDATICWFYEPEETPAGRASYHLPHEILATEHEDIVDYDTLMRPARVLGLEAFNEEYAVAEDPHCKHALRDTFVCRSFFDYRTRLVRPHVQTGEPGGSGSSIGSSSGKGGGGKRRQRKSGGGSGATAGSNTRYQIAPTELSEAEQYAATALALQLTSPPARLPCREMEREFIRGGIERYLKSGGHGSVLYLCGMPGTGKTALVTEVVHDLIAKAKSVRQTPFRFISINGMKLANPLDVYTQLAFGIADLHLPPSKAIAFLDKRFNNSARVTATAAATSSAASSSNSEAFSIVLVDELDLLMTKSQTIIYNLFNWPQLPYSRVMFICIANTMDLPERLDAKIASRMSSSRLTFKTYSKEQMSEIIGERLVGAGVGHVFTPDAVKIAGAIGTSADARRLLQICRKATDIAWERHESSGGSFTVSVSDVRRATSQLLDNHIVQSIQGCRPWEKLFLMALYRHKQTADMSSAQGSFCGLEQLESVITTMLISSGVSAAAAPATTAAASGEAGKDTTRIIDLDPPPYTIPRPGLSDLYAVAMGLHRRKIVEVVGDAMHRSVVVRLAVDVQDVAQALAHDPVGSKVLTV